MSHAPGRTPRSVFFALFAASGFAGLVYESLWSQYLKVFLGHAAYAQTLVLALFMGGMAAGAWLASLAGSRTPNLLRGYAVAEALVGVAALGFHEVFVAATDSAHATVLPLAGSAAAASAYKWTLAGALILPQSILLGATFPLMSAGIIRRHPERPGETLAMLYFTNSLGAALGVLAAGFFLLGELGLPGTMRAAGVVNLALAAAVWALAPGRDPAPPGPAPRPAAGEAAVPFALLLAVAFFTGLASFVYEIGWIRMLALVLGASTHSFELMLASFILGLAFGGLWVRRRIDTLRAPARFLGVVQVLMGLAALATLPLYGQMFDLMQAVMKGLARTESGYAMFLAASNAIALAVMFPATFFAGMTLPLITYSLLAEGSGERAIGEVYAANTAGAIAGVVLAAHVLMPLLGLKGMIAAGAAVDVALGLVLLGYGAKNRRPLGVAALVALFAFGAVAAGVNLDEYKMASGVFRRGQLYSAGDAELKFYRDGKTTSVALMQFDEGLSLRTNGKSDGAINLGPGPRISDEVTMVMTAALPLAYRPDAKRAAVIGIGTGLTTHTLLANLGLERVDTIEIEPAMAEAARGFAPRNGAAFADPRSRIVFDDAKTFFSTGNERYDIVISEPSNPWVSGVSSLFTTEFYRLVRRYLNAGGVLVQWFQLYEIDPSLVASVISALAENFPDFAIYAATDSDLLIVAGDTETLSRPLADVFALMPGVAKELRTVHVQSIGDIEVRRLGGRASLLPLFLSYNVPANSDYRPFLDLNAAKHRFLQTSAGDLTRLGLAGLPIVDMLEGRSGTRPLSYDGGDYLERIETARRAAYARDFLVGGEPPEPAGIPAQLQKDLELVKLRALDCSEPATYDVWLRSAADVAKVLNSGLAPAEATRVWRAFAAAPCRASLSERERELFALFAAIGARDAQAMARYAAAVLAGGLEMSSATKQYALAAGMAGNLLADRPADAVALWDKHSRDALRAGFDINLRLLYAYAHAAQAMQARK
ncbi:MAG: fused MFS/spermidine synthase [Burkholderiales bacterium]|nr:fused MFS/spermidine synthase [Burkholderiales bacterium]